MTTTEGRGPTLEEIAALCQNAQKARLTYLCKRLEALFMVKQYCYANGYNVMTVLKELEQKDPNSRPSVPACSYLDLDEFDFTCNSSILNI